MFKSQPKIPSDLTPTSPPISSRGSSRDGYEWIEWPVNSNTHWYQTDGTSSDGQSIKNNRRINNLVSLNPSCNLSVTVGAGFIANGGNFVSLNLD